MTQNEKFRLQRNAERREFLKSMFRNRDDDYPRIFAVGSYLAGAIYVCFKSGALRRTAETMSLLSPLLREIMLHSVISYLILGSISLLALFVYPFERKAASETLKAIGLVNHADMAPSLVCKSRDMENPRISIWHFRNQGIPLKTWRERQADIETALGITVVNMKYSHGNQRVLLYTVPAEDDLPKLLPWQDAYLLKEDFALALGQSHTEPVEINLADIPHILLGGSTGSGKSVLLKALIMQSLKKGAEVAIADFKGGVDFPYVWREQCHMCFDEKSLLNLLEQYVATLQKRKLLFSEAGLPNLHEYNKATGTRQPRYILACDEIAEVLDKTGLTKEQKELVNQIESRLSVIARQGRAFGIHLILATQRPDANILSGQIRNNINCRVCGRADNVLSQIILDTTAAADQIPKDAKGRFLLHDGTVFQGYWLDEKAQFPEHNGQDWRNMFDTGKTEEYMDCRITKQRRGKEGEGLW